MKTKLLLSILLIVILVGGGYALYRWYINSSYTAPQEIQGQTVTTNPGGETPNANAPTPGVIKDDFRASVQTLVTDIENEQNKNVEQLKQFVLERMTQITVPGESTQVFLRSYLAIDKKSTQGITLADLKDFMIKEIRSLIK